MAQERELIIKLGQKITDRIGHKVTVEDPEYYGLACVVTDEMAEVALAMKVRVPTTPEAIAKKCGKSVELTHQLMEEMRVIGVLEYNWGSADHHRQDVLSMFVPGCAEFMNMNKEQVETHPEVARMFERMSFLPLEKITPMIPPGGAGVGMHVIPVEKAIPTEQKSLSIEHISHWLKKYEGKYAVGACSCRRSRRILGEGCGHLEDDMCIGVGDMADYIVETGKGRYIDIDEVMEILQRAEDNGFVHQITNIDGEDKIFAICNCCVCSCYALRTSQYFNTPNMSRSSYIAKVDTEKCVACGQCVEYCPAGAVKLGQKLCTKEPIEYPVRELPDAVKWGPEKWSPDYRDENQINCYDTGTSPCKTNCPAHIAVQGYIKMAAQGNYLDAHELIKKENPFPAVCGRICNRSCEQACTRGELDNPVAIDDIKKFIAEQELDPAKRVIPKKRHDYHDKKIAIIGAGPAGLSCAYYLALDGYTITVFEKEKRLGGMLTLGIPAFRLEKDVVEAEIEFIKEMGVEFRTGIEVGKDVTLDQLRQDGYDAFYAAIGAQGGRKLGIDGEDAEGVLTGIEFLKGINSGNCLDLTGRTVVIGGGNVAVDVARAAVRCNSDSVSMHCLEGRDIMPASEEEILEAEEEGIQLCNGWGPKRILTENGHVTAVEFKKCLSVFDEKHRFAPQYDEEDCVVVPADQVIITVGQSIQWGNLLDGSDAERNPNQTIKADGFTYQSGEPDLFTGGDCYTGPKFAIDAITAGKQAAISIHRYVHPGQSLVYGRDRRQYKELDKKAAILEDYDHTPRQKPDHAKGDRLHSFRDYRGTLTEEQVQRETSRCLGCGVTKVDEYMCLGCGQCTTKCKFDAIHLERVYDAEGVEFTQMPPVVLKHVKKRMERIAQKKREEPQKEGTRES